MLRPLRTHDEMVNSADVGQRWKPASGLRTHHRLARLFGGDMTRSCGCGTWWRARRTFPS